MQDFDYTIEHRPSSRMSHVDALSRCINILVLEEESFEFALAVAQKRDPVILNIASDLENKESSLYELLNGLVYRKCGNDLRFYVPSAMEADVIRMHHESLSHLGVDKCHEYLKRAYWFPNMKTKIRTFIDNCLKCLYFSSKSGKPEGILYPIPKSNVPFDSLHIDHYGPLPTTKAKKKYIFLVIDSFTKFTRLYAVQSTKSCEAISCLKSYFNSYSKPKRIISDRGSCFTCKEFSRFLEDEQIQHIKIATMTPQANGQVERINRIITPMISKECDDKTTNGWDGFLPKVEFALNNTISKGTGYTPSMLLFGINQKSELCDQILDKIESNVGHNNENLEEMRRKAHNVIEQKQSYNKRYFDSRHKKPHEYRLGDYILLKGVHTNPGINKKFLPKYRGPYKIVKVLGHDRYFVKDIDDIQVSRFPYEGVCSANNMKPYHDLPA